MTAGEVQAAQSQADLSETQRIQDEAERTVDELTGRREVLEGPFTTRQLLRLDEGDGAVEPEGGCGHDLPAFAACSASCLAVQELIAAHCFSASGSRTLRVHASLALSRRAVPLKCGMTWLANRW